MASILIVEDHAHLREALARAFESRGHAVLHVANGEDAITVGLRARPAAAVVDLKLPGLSGLGAFAALKAERAELIGVGISGVFRAPEADRQCRELGFRGFFSKPLDVSELVDFVEHALGPRGETQSGVQEQTTADLSRPPAIIGESPGMRVVYRLIARVARTDATVLIRGETGTGKELVARAVHDASNRRAGPFVAVNSAGIPRELIESELFGSEPGAFTGAVARRGRFEEADGGTLFLDEVGDLSADAQAVLLRALDNKVVRHLGGSHERAVNVRIIAATNVDLAAAVGDGRVRLDLRHRLSEFAIDLPPLRERGDDVNALVAWFLPQVCGRLGVPVKQPSVDAWRALRTHGWPGNVRELQHALMQACGQAAGDVFAVDDLPAEVRARSHDAEFPAPRLPPGMRLRDATARMRAAAERRWIEEAIEGSRTLTEAARLLGVDRKTLYEKMSGLSIPARGRQ